MIGHPLLKISRHCGNTPPRCLIPHFPDDPKSRFLDELDDEITRGRNGASGQWKSVRSVDQFWDMMAFRQECSAGRLVGFIWIVFEPSIQHPPTESVLGDSQSTTMTGSSQTLNTDSSVPPSSFNALSQIHPTSSPVKFNDNNHPPSSHQSVRSSKPSTHIKKQKLTGPIIPRRPRIKTENRNYLLERPESTAYYVWHPRGRGQVIVDESDYKRVTELLLRLDFANVKLATSGSRRWINEVRSGAWGDMRDAWGQTVTGTKVMEFPKEAGPRGVNTLNMGLVRKKRKGGDAKETPAPTPQVNVLSAGMVRKKAKA